MWIHGDLHAENFGTYMDSNGRLIFNVNDFDEAYVGPFTWDLKRFAACVALIGYAKALGDDEISELVQVTRPRTASGSTRWPPAARATRCRPSPWTPPRALSWTRCARPLPTRSACSSR